MRTNKKLLIANKDTIYTWLCSKGVWLQDILEEKRLQEKFINQWSREIVKYQEFMYDKGVHDYKNNGDI